MLNQVVRELAAKFCPQRLSLVYFGFGVFCQLKMVKHLVHVAVGFQVAVHIVIEGGGPLLWALGGIFECKLTRAAAVKAPTLRDLRVSILDKSFGAVEREVGFVRGQIDFVDWAFG